MPRTKVSKTSKRNREEQIIEEKVRQFHDLRNDYINRLDTKIQSRIEDWENNFTCYMQRVKIEILEMNMKDFFKMCVELKENALRASVTDSVITRAVQGLKSHDEGYLTEDSSGGNAALKNIAPKEIVPLIQNSTQKRLRTPGPLNTAILRTRRSRSATPRTCICTPHITHPSRSPSRPRMPCTTCNPIAANSIPQSSVNVNNIVGGNERQARSKFRSSQKADRASHAKAHSADPTRYKASSYKSPPAAFMRWPKPGELIMSMSGTPIVAQALPDTCANVTIPVRDGVLSLRPKKLEDFHTDILDNIKPETLDQLKTLHSNIDKIVNLAEQKVANERRTGAVKKSTTKNKPK